MSADIKNKKIFLEYENMEVWFQMFSFFIRLTCIQLPLLGYFMLKLNVVYLGEIL